MKLHQSGDSLFTRKYLEPTWSHEKNKGYNILNLHDSYYLIYGVQNEEYTTRTPSLLKIDNSGNLIWKQVEFFSPDDV